MIKKILLVVCMITSLFSFGVANAWTDAGAERTADIISRLEGTWKADDGSAIAKFKKGYLNGDKITGIDIGAGGGSSFGCRIHIIAKRNGEGYFYNARLVNLGKPDDLDSQAHEKLYVGNIQSPFRRNGNIVYEEVIGGLFLEMYQGDVLKLLGGPDLVTPQNGRQIWNYNKRGLKVELEDARVVQITVYNWSNLAFKGSGLTANNTLSEFLKAYDNPHYDGTTGLVNVGGNEYIRVIPSENCVVFTLYPY